MIFTCLKIYLLNIVFFKSFFQFILSFHREKNRPQFKNGLLRDFRNPKV